MLEQTKNAIDKLRKAGLKRSQFSTRVTRRYIGKNDRGKAEYEYGDVKISLKDSEITGLEWAKRIASQGLHTQLLKFDFGDSLRVIDSYPKRHVVEILDYRNGNDMYDAVAGRKTINMSPSPEIIRAKIGTHSLGVYEVIGFEGRLSTGDRIKVKPKDRAGGLTKWANEEFINVIVDAYVDNDNYYLLSRM